VNLNSFPIPQYLTLCSSGGHGLAIETGTSGVRAIAGRIRFSPAPSPTSAPYTYLGLQKRVSETRKAVTFGACSLKKDITAKAYPEPFEYSTYSFADRISKFWVLSKSSTENDKCFAGYVYSTNNIVSDRLFPLQNSRKLTVCHHRIMPVSKKVVWCTLPLRILRWPHRR
jgi:hypothetical protein